MPAGRFKDKLVRLKQKRNRDRLKAKIRATRTKPHAKKKTV